MTGATGRGQQRRKRQAVGTGAAMIVELIGDVRAGMKMRVCVRLGAQLRNEQRQRHEQRQAQIGCLAQDFQKGYSRVAQRYYPSQCIWVNLSPLWLRILLGGPINQREFACHPQEPARLRA